MLPICRAVLIGLGIAQTAVIFIGSVFSQDKSVNPGINDSFKDPKVQEYIEKFEIESREVFQRRDAILAACAVKPGSTVADVGAGTGLFTRLFSKSVGDQGRVIAVDISKNFLEHIAKTNREQDLRNIDTLLCTADSTELQAETIDFAFICDTYHHFEYPNKTMASLHKALRPGGRLVVIDFKRVEGQSTPWVMSHVRAGQEVFEKEILECGFVKLEQKENLLKENYFLVFQKPR
jgi:ubiquinone/menaquinone biosynthesis C-methylase UbiE